MLSVKLRCMPLWDQVTLSVTITCPASSASSRIATLPCSGASRPLCNCRHDITTTYYCILPSVLWHCWLGGRKGIRPVKNWVVGCWCGYLSGASCRLAYGPADANATHCLFASVKSRLVLPFWYQLTQIVLEKGPLNGCACVLLLHTLYSFSLLIYSYFGKTSPPPKKIQPLGELLLAQTTWISWYPTGDFAEAKLLPTYPC